MNQELITQQAPIETGPVSVFSDMQKFEDTLRMADFLSNSDLVPQQFKRNQANCLIALEMANRCKADPLMVMQNLYVVHGKPSWSAQFLIACVNKSGRFSPLQYEFTGTKGQMDWGCKAYAKDLISGETVYGPEVTMQMASDEGWSTKNGSKWKTIPELMLTYRAATFFVRTKAPEISMGMHTDDEVRDMGKAEVVIEDEHTSSTEELKATLNAFKAPPEEEPAPSEEKPKAKKTAKAGKAKAKEVDQVELFKQSIDSCPDYATLMQCGEDIKNAQKELSEEQYLDVKRYFDGKLKALKAEQESQQ